MQARQGDTVARRRENQRLLGKGAASRIQHGRGFGVACGGEAHPGEGRNKPDGVNRPDISHSTDGGVPLGGCVGPSTYTANPARNPTPKGRPPPPDKRAAMSNFRRRRGERCSRARPSTRSATTFVTSHLFPASLPH